MEPPPFDICERTFQFALRIVGVCQVLDKQHGVSWTLSKQLLRSGTSIGANVEEGQAGQSRADFVSKYSIARKELRETRYWLRLLRGSDLLEANTAAPLLAECDELLKILTSIIRKTQGN
jgi:four helix bundle protein